MPDFIRDMLTVNPLLGMGVIAGLLASVCCGLVGPYVVARRVVFLSGAIAHIALAGIGLSIYLNHHYEAIFFWFSPMMGATVVSLISAVLLAFVSIHARGRLDTLIGAMWATGMAIGLTLIKLTPGYNTDAMSFLFGNLTAVSQADVNWLTGVTVFLAITVLLTHKMIFTVCLDEEQATLQGVNPLLGQMLLLVLIALTVISLMQVVGLILVIALLTLPPAAVGCFVKRILPIMGLTIVLCVLLTTVPRVAVYGTRLSPESVIVITSGLVYLLALLVQRVINMIQKRVGPGLDRGS